KQRDPAGDPFLIVAPTSVVANWPAEAARCAAWVTAVARTACAFCRGRGPACPLGDPGAQLAVRGVLGLFYASRNRSASPPMRSAAAAQAARTPRPAQGLMGRLCRPVVSWMVSPAFIGAYRSIRCCQCGLLARAAAMTGGR